MKYAMLIHYKPDYYEALPEDEQKTLPAQYRALGQDPRARYSVQFQPSETATTVRVQAGETRTAAGPYADLPEELGAYYVFELDDLDEAIELAARFPAARLGGAIEIRPLVER